MASRNSQKPCWDFRPTALTKDYKDATPSSLIEKYVQDGSRAAGAAANGSLESAAGTIVIPDKPQSCIRVCQWNIHYLSAPWLGPDEDGRRSGDTDYDLNHADLLANAILDTNSDVVVLNEFRGFARSQALDRLRRRLEVEGDYALHDLATCAFPTVVATRLGAVISSEGIRLDRRDISNHRAAVRVTLDLSTVSRLSANSADMSSMTFHIYGTHLDDRSKRQRFRQAKTLIRGIDQDSPDPVLIIGDFNQQRQRDYSEDEWKLICRNKSERESPKNDGVSALIQDAGYMCCYDQQRENKEVKTNWRTGDPPPSTHWSSTVIDYAYGRNADAVGIYVSPSNLSDHRMVVTDWRLASAELQNR